MHIPSQILYDPGFPRPRLVVDVNGDLASAAGGYFSSSALYVLIIHTPTPQGKAGGRAWVAPVWGATTSCSPAAPHVLSCLLRHRY